MESPDFLLGYKKALTDLADLVQQSDPNRVRRIMRPVSYSKNTTQRGRHEAKWNQTDTNQLTKKA